MKAEEGSTEDKRREEKGSGRSFSRGARLPRPQPPDTSLTPPGREASASAHVRGPTRDAPTARKTHCHSPPRTHGPQPSGSASHRDRTGVPDHHRSERKWAFSRTFTPLAPKKSTFSKASEETPVFTAVGRKITEVPTTCQGFSPRCPSLQPFQLGKGVSWPTSPA